MNASTHPRRSRQATFHFGIFVALAAAAAWPVPPQLRAQPPVRDAIITEDAAEMLFADGRRPPACSSLSAEHSRISCLLHARFSGAPRLASAARYLFDRHGDLLGLGRSEVMDGGYRGVIRLVPELPVGRWSRHVRWITEAADDFEAFFAELGRTAPRAPEFRYRPVAFRFFRSVGRTTPSAYAQDWTVYYNVAGSLFRSADATREVLFHEIFHLNDAAHAGWSARVLATLHARIVARCGTARRCLAPYAPTGLTVRGGTYYAFQPDNGDAFAEYAAELATRYYREQRARLQNERLRERPFKCGPTENAEAWTAIGAEFFGGLDRVAPCTR